MARSCEPCIQRRLTLRSSRPAPARPPGRQEPSTMLLSSARPPCLHGRLSSNVRRHSGHRCGTYHRLCGSGHRTVFVLAPLRALAQERTQSRLPRVAAQHVRGPHRLVVIELASNLPRPESVDPSTVLKNQTRPTRMPPPRPAYVVYLLGVAVFGFGYQWLKATLGGGWKFFAVALLLLAALRVTAEFTERAVQARAAKKKRASLDATPNPSLERTRSGKAPRAE
jgi:hypothetical protein